jgi:hypothetical protein
VYICLLIFWSIRRNAATETAATRKKKKWSTDYANSEQLSCRSVFIFISIFLILLLSIHSHSGFGIITPFRCFHLCERDSVFMPQKIMAAFDSNFFKAGFFKSLNQSFACKSRKITHIATTRRCVALDSPPEGAARPHSYAPVAASAAMTCK